MKSADMIQRILTGWTFSRGMYLAIGTVVIVQSVIDEQWLGVLFASYFALMGLFAFGCAAGNCFKGSCKVENNRVRKEEGINFEE